MCELCDSYFDFSWEQQFLNSPNKSELRMRTLALHQMIEVAAIRRAFASLATRAPAAREITKGVKEIQSFVQSADAPHILMLEFNSNIAELCARVPAQID